MALKTDYKDYIPTGDTRVFNIVNADGTIVESEVRFEDVTTYEQEGNIWGATDFNATNIKVNELDIDVENLKNGVDMTLTVVGWSATAPFTQTLAINGLLDTDKPSVEVIYNSTTLEEQKTQVTEASKMALNPQSVVGGIEFTCYEEKPTIDLTVRVKGV